MQPLQGVQIEGGLPRFAGTEGALGDPVEPGLGGGDGLKDDEVVLGLPQFLHQQEPYLVVEITPRLEDLPLDVLGEIRLGGELLQVGWNLLGKKSPASRAEKREQHVLPGPPAEQGPLLGEELPIHKAHRRAAEHQEEVGGF